MVALSKPSSTRLKSISGEEIIIANTDLTGSRIRNFKRMQQRRIKLLFDLPQKTQRDLSVCFVFVWEKDNGFVFVF